MFGSSNNGRVMKGCVSHLLVFVVTWLVCTIETTNSGIGTLDPMIKSENVSTIHHRTSGSTAASTSPIESISLVPGDLPTYTGWTRPSYTSAPFYQITYPNEAAQVNILWTVNFTCVHKTCLGQNPKFYARAYGPSVVSGITETKLDIQMQTYYSLSLMLRDPGVYWVEAVLDFSNAPTFEMYPDLDETAGYEGYLLPGMPIRLFVKDETNPAKKHGIKNLCTVEEMTVNNTYEGYYKSRWIVTDKINQNKDRNKDYATQVEMSLHGYTQSLNSLGIFMELKPESCELVKDATSPYFRDPDLHFIFIGDSVMSGKILALQNRIKGGNTIKVTQLDTQGGLEPQLPILKQALTSLNITQPEKTFVFFNAGLHEILGCSQVFKHDWGKFRNPVDGSYSCTTLYQDRFQRLVTIVDAIPAKLKVFSSTHAAWPKWGNWGLEWAIRDDAKERKQGFPFSTHMVAHFNELAFDILSNSTKSICVMDEYWLTLARPDNREIFWGEGNAGKHMAHPGLEVFDAMVHQCLTIVLASLSS